MEIRGKSCVYILCVLFGLPKAVEATYYVAGSWTDWLFEDQRSYQASNPMILGYIRIQGGDRNFLSNNLENFPKISDFWGRTIFSVIFQFLKGLALGAFRSQEVNKLMWF